MTTARYRPTWDLALDPLVSCKLCLGEYPVEQMTTIAQCQCIFCTLCLKQYVELLIKEGLETAISCPDAACPKQGHLQEDEIECMVAAEIMQRYKKLQFEREVLLDPCRTWCPTSTCQAVCQLQDMGLQTPQLVRCKACDVEFCSACKASWHPGQGCPETMPITFLPGETSSAFKLEEDDAPIKRCPKCKVYIERDEGCAQMMCKNCKHAFCWYCLESLDDDFLLIHYDKGPCRNKLGHSRASVIWHRTQVVGWLHSLAHCAPSLGDSHSFEHLGANGPEICWLLPRAQDSRPHCLLHISMWVPAGLPDSERPNGAHCSSRYQDGTSIPLKPKLSARFLEAFRSC
ncbi:E3 ubiquitin-protein ligase RNF144A isoform X4 [Acinonyx jubatus]|nr:E3 ubiquitin-protein ligase RNF144A isoform X4 [Acinonyx jubatus]XP_053057248.1 E3 ubiquitin-protein ligase RNF144A isoform X4 [Acinonyx jubatus]XP_053057249.1 E3 ubiquitin-protein ligase RNF144A isoform X4 [Acinonyx jubatus]XP_053057250.1 E3 ubiquitin-protein ligase RNF144A isoform X4 [Acinonyx jubatus]XP_053057251.1 E3 ubiquitin-protein ligase RNF144A isoform X4 [Acinonyx jubatus]XP_053057252.1 E3 ubiquitin-protein ligase RNF144A isoform X4 [Acinonyx jubatus]XP_053057253.1 E3 ubiquitin-p